MLATMIDWTQVLVLGVPAYIAAILTPLVTVIVMRNRRDIQPPSGGRIGAVVEQAAHIGNATNASVNMLHERLNGDDVLPKRAPDA